MLTRARDHSLRSNGSSRQRLQGRFVDGFPHTGPRSVLLAERPVIQLVEQFADGHVQFFEREELAMAQRRHDPALGHLHGIFDLGFVSRLVRPRGHDAEAAVQREVVIGRIQIRIVAMRLGHAGLGVVGNRQRRNAAKVFEGVHVTAQPRFHLLIARGLGPGVGTGAQRGHEQRRLPSFARCAGRRPESSRPPNRRTSSRRPCAPAAAPRRASSASAGTARRSASSDSRPGSLAGIPPTAVAGSRTCCCAVARGSRRSPAACAPACAAASRLPRRRKQRGFHPRFIPIFRQRPASRPPPRLASGTCEPCSPRSRNFARSAGSPV